MKKNFYKRIIAIALCAMIAFPASLAVSAVEADTVDYSIYGVTKLISPYRLNENIELQIVDDYLKTVNVNGSNYSPEQIKIDYYGKSQDGSMFIYAEHEGAEFSGEIAYLPINGYIYVYEVGKDVKIYKNNTFYSISELYNSGQLTSEEEYSIIGLGLQEMRNGEKTKSDIQTLIMCLPVGDTYTKETAEPFYEALFKANEVIDDEKATTEEITEAYYALSDAFYHLELTNWDESELTFLYHYGTKIENEFLQFFSTESTEKLSSLVSNAQMALLYAQSQEEVDKAADELATVIKNLEQTTENSNIISYEEAKNIYELTEIYFAELLKDKRHKDYSAGFPEFVDFKGYRLMPAYTDSEYFEERTERMNGYIFERNHNFNPSIYGILAVNTSSKEILTLEDAISKGVIDMKKLFHYVDLNYFDFNMYLIGDVDYNGLVNISDATYIQKVLADLAYKDDKNLKTDSPFDFNGDGTVNIIDATDIQKALVS